MKTRHILIAADTTDNSARSASDLGPRHRRMQQPEGATNWTIRFSFGIARVLDHSLWYADKLVVQLNGCASSRP